MKKLGLETTAGGSKHHPRVLDSGTRNVRAKSRAHVRDLHPSRDPPSHDLQWIPVVAAD